MNFIGKPSLIAAIRGALKAGSASSTPRRGTRFDRSWVIRRENRLATAGPPNRSHTTKTSKATLLNARLVARSQSL